MRTIAIVNQKGGCGKTTTAINLAALYARRGLRTLLVDMDPQSHCAAGLGVPEARIEYSIGDALLANHSGNFNPSQLAWEVSRNLYLAPSTVMLAALEAPGGGLHQLPDKDRRLESLLNLIGDRYDRCLVDCPPTIGLLTFNAMRAAREALIPVETGFFSLRGAERQWTTIQRMIAHIGRPIACHMLATLHNPQSQLACNILAALRRQFAGQILPTIIREHEVLREAASFGQPVLEYAPDSEARADFEALADWLEEHAARPVAQIEIIKLQPLPENSATNSLTSGQSRALELLSDPSYTTSPQPFAEPVLPRSEVPSLGGSRAAELARRVHELAARGSMRAPESDIAATAGTAVQEPEPIESQQDSDLSEALSMAQARLAPLIIEKAATPDQAVIDEHPPQLTHVYGVRHTSQGVLFVQPANGAREMCVAGDFNCWSPSANPLRLNEQAGVFETIIALRPGSHQYRVVIDGEWLADPHNQQRQLNSYGEPNSVVTVGPP